LNEIGPDCAELLPEVAEAGFVIGYQQPVFGASDWIETGTVVHDFWVNSRFAAVAHPYVQAQLPVSSLASVGNLPYFRRQPYFDVAEPEGTAAAVLELAIAAVLELAIAAVLELAVAAVPELAVAAVLELAVAAVLELAVAAMAAPALMAESPGLRRALSHSAQSPVFQPEFSWLHPY
jgi:hypothetical protein